MSDEGGFYINVDYPDSIKRIRGRHSTKISISKVFQRGVYLGGYADDERWLVSVYIITDVCRVCGFVPASVQNPPEREHCSRHSWDHAVAMLLLTGAGKTVEEAMKDAGDQAEQFNKDPEARSWRIEQFLYRREYLQANSRISNKG